LNRINEQQQRWLCSDENDEIWNFLLVLPDIDERPFNGGLSVQSVLTAQAHAKRSWLEEAEGGGRRRQ